MKLDRRQLLCLTALTVLNAKSSAQDEPPAGKARVTSDWAYPGGMVEIHLEKLGTNLPTVKFGLREPVIIEADQSWRVLIGLDLNLLPGEYVVYAKIGDFDEPAFPIRFEVRQKRYELVDANVAQPPQPLAFDSLSEIDFANTVPPELPLKLPVAGDWPDNFGQLWISESRPDEVRQQNYLALSSTDADSPETQTVVAPQNGIVSRIIGLDEKNENGITICIDHGRGLYTVVQGILDVIVESGDGIIAGAVIGTSRFRKLSGSSTSLIGGGSSPESRGVNAIRWQCILNGVAVNPLILTRVSA